MGNINVVGGPLEFVALLDSNNIGRGIAQIDAQLRGLTQTAQQQADAVEKLANRASAAISSYLTLSGAKDFIGEIIRVRSEFAQLEVSFRTMLGSKEKADKLMAEAVQLAATTPFSLQEVAGGAKQLLGYGFAADKITSSIKTLGNVAAGVGAPLNDIIYLYGTLQTQGRAYTRDIMQFTSRGIPIIQELAKQFGVTQDKIAGMVEAGKIGFPEVEKAFQSMTGAGGLFFNLMEEQSKTIGGQISNLKDAFATMLNEIGRSNEGTISEAISGLSYLVKNYQTVIDILEVLLVTYGAYKAAVIATTAVNIIASDVTNGLTVAQSLQTRAAILGEKVMALLNRTMLANPAVLIGVSIAALATIMYKLSQNTEHATIDFKGFNEELAKEEAKLKSTFDAVKQLAEGTEQRRQSIALINKEYGSYLPKLLSENATNKDLLDTYNLLNKAIETNIGLKYSSKATDSLKTETGSKKDEAVNKLVSQISDPNLAGQAAADLSTLEKQILSSSANFDKYSHIIGNARTLISDFNKKYNIGSGFNRFNSPVVDYIKASIEEANGLQQIEQFKKGLAGNLPAAKDTAAKIKTLADNLKDFSGSGNLASVDAAIKQIASKVDADAVKKAVDEKFEAFLPTEKEKFRAEYAKRSNALRDIIKSYSLDDTKDKNTAQKELKAENKALEEREALLNRLKGLHLDADRSGLLKEQSEISKTNELYNEAIRLIDLHNKKYPKAPVGQAAINSLNQDRAFVLGNLDQKADAKTYLDSLDEKKKAFADYQEAVKQIGIEKADEMYKGQTEGFTSYVDFLQSELNKLAPKLVFGIASLGDKLKGEGLTTEFNKAAQEARLKDFEEQKTALSTLLQTTATFADKRQEIDLRYNKQFKALAALRSKISLVEFADRTEALKKSQEEEYNILNSSMLRQSSIYKKLSFDILGASREDIKKRIQIIRDELKSGKTTIGDDINKKTVIITPEMEQDIEENERRLLDAAENMAKFGDLTVTQLNEIAEKAQGVSGVFSQMAEAVRPLNENLANTLSAISGISSAASSAISGIGQIAKGIEAIKLKDTKGAAEALTSAASSIIAAVSFTIKLWSTTSANIKAIQKEIASFNDQILLGEVDVNIQYRERLSMQAQLNKLRLDGLKAEKQQLEANKASNVAQYQQILDLLYGEKFISGKKKVINTSLSSLLSGKIVDVQNELASLAGKSFDQLNELFLKGQLTDKAKELFLALQKLKAEGVDIDKQLQDLKQQQDELFTGTTSNAIADSIVEGFKQGKRSAADFASAFQDLMTQAFFNALKAKAIEPFAASFFDNFAKLAGDADGLTNFDISALEQQFGTGIEGIRKQFDAFQALASKLNFSTSNSSNSLAGAITGIRAEQADLLAGRLGGMGMTLIEQQKILQQHLNLAVKIEANTYNTAANTALTVDILNNFKNFGIKIKP